jgi:drug/metabolite transporter (DMT)-like permease
MELQDTLALLHPAIAIIVVFPLIGIVVNRAVLTRQRRLQVADGEKSKIPPLVGSEHVAIGNWLSRSVVGVALLGMAYPIFSKMLSNDTLTKEPFRVFFAIAIFLLTIASFTLLFKAKVKLWRGIFATLTGMGLIILGFQPEVYRRDNEWFISHYYYGITAALLMIFSLAIVQDIYQDKQNRWRTAHIILNCFAVLLFIGQGMTGARDLLEIPLHWQEQYIYKCDFTNKTCPQPK